jgi:predicted nucleotidyltransferase
MHERINSELDAIESKNGCRILYACESGSRAWGFASPDSDYDVRFVYTHPRAWHLQLQSRADILEQMTEDDLDLSGWELAKTLRLFAGCNLPLNEWFESPFVYRSILPFADEIRSLIPHYFNPRKAAHHYYSLARKTAQAHFRDGSIGIKKAFYILRPMLAGRWVLDRKTMPPMQLSQLLVQLPDGPVLAAIRDLLARKVCALEGQRIELDPMLVGWIDQNFDEAESQMQDIPFSPPIDWVPLNRLMRDWVPITALPPFDSPSPASLD